MSVFDEIKKYDAEVEKRRAIGNFIVLPLLCVFGIVLYVLDNSTMSHEENYSFPDTMGTVLKISADGNIRVVLFENGRDRNICFDDRTVNEKLWPTACWSVETAPKEIQELVNKYDTERIKY